MTNMDCGKENTGTELYFKGELHCFKGELHYLKIVNHVLKK